MEWQLKPQNQVLHNLTAPLADRPQSGEPVISPSTFGKGTTSQCCIFTNTLDQKNMSAIFTLKEHLDAGLNSGTVLDRLLVHILHAKASMLKTAELFRFPLLKGRSLTYS